MPHPTPTPTPSTKSELASSADLRGLVFTSGARIAPPSFDPTALRQLANQRAIDPAIFETHPPYFWQARLSNNELDAYDTRMAASSLRNFAADAQTDVGVSFQNSHHKDCLGLGRSLTGVYQESGDVVGTYYDGGGVQRSIKSAETYATFYTASGLDLGAGLTTDQFIAGVKSGVVRDVSIGFYGGLFRCAICGQDYFDWGCRHYAGMNVDIPILNDSGDVVNTVSQSAFLWVEEARLSETSAVYDGATPGAMILKAERDLGDGRLRPDAARFLEQRYRVRLPGSRAVFGAPAAAAAAAVPASQPELEQEAAMPPVPEVETRPPTTTTTTTTVPTLAPTTGADGGDAGPPAQAADPKPALSSQENARWLELETTVRAKDAEIERLKPLADDGRAYRADLIADALAQGVRALGQTFAEETYRTVLAGAPIETIKRLRDDWQTVGDGRFPVGALIQPPKTTGQTNGHRASAAVPDYAYRTG